MGRSSDTAFDFEHWARLAKADPEGFEVRRAQQIAALIAAASPQNRDRLRGLQWRIDTVRRRAVSPLSSCVQIFNQMWDAVYGERGLQEALRAMDGPALAEPVCADIVELQPPHRTHNNNKIPRPFTRS